MENGRTVGRDRARLEGLRVALVREFYRGWSRALLVVLRIAPGDHPGRIFLEGAVKGRRQQIISSLTPQFEERVAADLAWSIVGLLALWSIVSGLTGGNIGPGNAIAWLVSEAGK